MGATRRRPKRDPIVVPPPAGGSRWSGLGHDVRYGVRVLRRQPGFAAVAVLTIALGVGATTTLFGVAWGVLIKPLPWPNADRLVRVTEMRGGRAGRVRGTVMNGTYVAWADKPATIAGLGGWRRQTMTLIVGGGEAARVAAVPITPSAFPMLEAQPVAGRLFTEQDATFGPPDFAILSYGLWQERFGGQPDAVGRTIQLDERPVAVVGVMPRGFAFPDREARLWTAWRVPPVAGPNGLMNGVIFSAMARLKPGATPEQASAEATGRARGAPSADMVARALFGVAGPIDVRATPALEALTADVKPAITVLLASVVLLLATAIANVASLQLARAATRRHELAVRAALGAGLGRLTRQLIVENAMLALAGGAAGLVMAAALSRVLPSVLPADFPRLDDVRVDAAVVLFAFAASLVTTLVCGLMPARHARRVNLVESLGDGGADARGGVGRQTARARAAIMAGQVAVACVLLVGGALLTRSFVAMMNADRGYDPANLLTARIGMPAPYTLERRGQVLDDLVARMRREPGVREAAYGNALPLVSSGGFRSFKMRPPSNPSVEIDVETTQRVVSPAYFAALGLRLRDGRVLSEADTLTAPMAIVVNRTFADRYLGARPVGAIVPNLGMCRGNGDRWEVVGVVDDMRQGAIGDQPQAELFLPFRQIGCLAAMADGIVTVRTAGDPAAYAGRLRAHLRAVAPTLGLDSIMTMDDRVTTSLARPRTYALLVGVFALFALAIAAVGVFGVLSYSVAQRTREFGVRVALGARPADIMRLILRQLVVVAGGGLVAGLALAFAGATSLSTFLYGVQPHDIVSFLAVPAGLLVVIAIACIVPARRAAGVDPLRALRAG